MPTHFPPEAMTFLRGLARHNDRLWFEQRRDVYERSLKAPLLALVDEISAAMEAFAPDHVRPPHKITMRIYRDIRFSKDKLPYKTHLSAWWARQGMEKTSGAGFYLQISPQEVMLAAGVYMPERHQLLTLRRWMTQNHATYRASLTKLLKTRGAGFDTIDAQELTRMPKGFAADDPAGELLRAKNWGVRSSLPAELALQPGLARQIVRRFKLASPLVHTLNSAILQQEEGAATDREIPAFAPARIHTFQTVISTAAKRSGEIPAFPSLLRRPLF
jgi:uncharacterized protein (TIGR02453 family)